MADWTDSIVGERMAVDREFTERVAASQFTRQEWGLIMTAIEFEIEAPEDPEAARIVVDDAKLDQIMPELDAIQSGMADMGMGAPTDRDAGGGILASIKGALGIGSGGGGVDPERRQAAVELTEEYAAALQDHLQSRGRWEEVRTVAAHDPVE